MKRFYDQHNHRLVYVGQASDPDFWDAHWQAADFQRAIRVPHHRFILGHTSRYLQPGARILEGGCGRGDKVYALTHHGYDAYGVDYAPETVERIRRYAPELKVSLGDVRRLEFPDGFFDGYWSLGVIEHFPEGYDPILREMQRVLKPGGYIFLTCPAMSALRAIKARLRCYPAWPLQPESWDGFYQFALDPRSVVARFEAAGFARVERRFHDGFYGLMQEWPMFDALLGRAYESPRLPARVLRAGVNALTAAWAGHIALLILRKR